MRIHDSILMAESKYKCLLISEHTTGELHSYCNILLSYLLCHTDTMQYFSKKHKICEYVQGRGTSVLGEVRNVELSRVPQQLICSKSHDFLAVFALAHSIKLLLQHRSC